jgi:hypothetical protein
MEITYEFDFVQGEQALLVVEFQELDGVPADLTGKAFTFIAREAPDSPATLVELSTDTTNAGGDLTVDLPTGVVTIALDASTTDAMPAGVWALWSDPDGEDADAVVWGDLTPRKVVRP